MSTMEPFLKNSYRLLANIQMYDKRLSTPLHCTNNRVCTANFILDEPKENLVNLEIAINHCPPVTL